MPSVIAASQGLTPPKTGLTSLAAETRQIVDRHQEIHARTSRKLSLFGLGLLILVTVILILLSASAVRA